MRGDFCTHPGCDVPRVAGSFEVQGRWLCPTHLSEFRSRLNGDDGSQGRRPRLTDEERSEIRRRLARFENPKDIARDLGVSKHTVLDVSRRTA